jgi:hypothetical protein
VTFRRLVLGVTGLAILAMAVRTSVDSDTWWHLRAGAWMLEHGRWLTVDPFSLTRQGQPWLYPGWLAQVALLVDFRTFGYAGLDLLTGFMVLLAFMCLWPVLETGPLVRGFVLVFAASASGVFWSARPQIFTLALTGAFVAMLEAQRLGRIRVWWLLPLGMLLWVNLHGGFAVGLLLIGLYVLGELTELLLAPLRGALRSEVWAARRTTITDWLIGGALSLAAVSLNPVGPRMIFYPLQTVSIHVLREYIQEWQSPSFHQLQMQPFLLMVILLMVTLAASRRRPRATALILVAVFTYLGFDAARNIGLFAIVTAPVLARHLEASVESLRTRFRGGRQVPERLARALNMLLFVLVTLGAAARIATQLPDSVNRQAIEQAMPVGAVDFVQAKQPPGPLFNSYNWGGYVLWRLYPNYLSFVDGRTDLFDDEILNSYLAAWSGQPSWKSLFEKWGIRLVMIEPEAPLVTVLQSSGWQVLYQDPISVVLAPQAQGGKSQVPLMTVYSPNLR